jgi:hypothetical protein
MGSFIERIAVPSPRYSKAGLSSLNAVDRRSVASITPGYLGNVATPHHRVVTSKLLVIS